MSVAVRRAAAFVLGVLFALPVLIGVSATAEVTGVPQIVIPDASTPEVAGGWTGPVEVDFASAAPGSYSVSLQCGGGYQASITHVAPDQGPLLSWEFPALPEYRSCSLAVTPAENDQAILDNAEFITGSAQLELWDVTAPQAFYPRVVDGYADKLKVDFWITQVADVSGTIRNPDGAIIRALHRRQDQSGPGQLVWDGRGTDGRFAKPARYTMEIVATNWRGEQATATRAFYLADLVPVTPGRIGPARAGITKAQAMATGAFRSNVTYTVPGVCTKVVPLEPKPPYRRTYEVFMRKGAIYEATVTDMRQVRLPRGLSAAATAGQVRRAYGGNVRAGMAGYGNNALFVRSGGRWIAYVFRSYRYDRGLISRDKLYFVSVAKGHKPKGLTSDGC